MTQPGAGTATLPQSTIPTPLRSGLLSALPYVRHGLTYRVPGMGKADGNVGLGTPRDREDAWQMRVLWCAGIGVDPERIVTMGQVHGNTVIRVGAGDAGKGARDPGTHIGYGDALITDAPDVVLATLHADCQPILLVDPERPAVAAVHAGWRGTVADVGGATVAAMGDAYGSDPARMLAYLGPAIGPEQNEVGGFAPTYFPGTSDAAAATPVTVAFAADSANTTFALSPAKTLSVSGTMVDAQGRPVAGRGTLWLATPDRLKKMDFNLARAVTTSDGRFVLRNVPQGSYTIQGFGPPPADYKGPMNLGAMPFGWAAVTVGDSDLDDVLRYLQTLRGFNPAVKQ